jgi:transposase
MMQLQFVNRAAALVYLTMHETTRTYRPAVGTADAALPATTTQTRRPVDDRPILNGIFWRLNTGAPWRDLPDRFGKWKTVHDRFSKLRKSGLLDRLLEALQLRLDQRGLIDFDLWCVDGSSIRASRAAAGASAKKK